MLKNLFASLIVLVSFSFIRFANAQIGSVPFQLPKIGNSEKATGLKNIVNETYAPFIAASSYDLNYLKSGKNAMGWAVPAGVYRVRLTDTGGSVNSVKCMTYDMGGDWWWIPNLGDITASPGFWRAQTCGNWIKGNNNFGNHYEDTGLVPAIAIIPATANGTKSGRYTMRPVLWDNVARRTITPPSGNNEGANGISNRIRYCLTIARGVVVGPPRIDILPCAPNQDGMWEHAGAGDQTFNILRVGPAPYRALGNIDGFSFNAGASFDLGTFKFVGSDSNGAGCIATRAPAPFVMEGEGILWECNDEALQKFELEYLGNYAEPTNNELARLGFVLASDGLVFAQRIEGAQIAPVAMNADGTANSTIFDSKNDGGYDCANLCSKRTFCRAYTWYRPQTLSKKAQCQIMNVVGTASATPDAVSGVIRP